MWRGLDRSFALALKREGVQVQIGDASKTVLFRRQRNSQDSADWVDIYCAEGDNLRPGDVITAGQDNYLLVQRDHRLNGVYSRFNAVRCNQSISLCKLEKSKEPNKYGEYEEYLVPYATTPAYMATQLTGLDKTVIGNAIGGNIAVIMPAYPLDNNTPIQCSRFDDDGGFSPQEYALQSYDCTDVFTDNEGNIHGILRLQIKP